MKKRRFKKKKVEKKGFIPAYVPSFLGARLLFHNKMFTWPDMIEINT